MSLIIIAASLVSGSCAKGVTPFSPSMLGLQSWEMAPCAGKAYQATIRIKLDGVLDLSALGRNLRYSISDADNDENDSWGKELIDSTAPNPRKIRPFHIDRANVAGVSVGNWVLVRIVLYDKRFKFSGIGDPNAAIQGVAVNTKEKDPEFCSNAVVELPARQSASNAVQREREVASFMFQVDPVGSSKKAYSIILRSNAVDDTPIIIDPKILNNG